MEKATLYRCNGCDKNDDEFCCYSWMFNGQLPENCVTNVTGGRDVDWQKTTAYEITKTTDKVKVTADGSCDFMTYFDKKNCDSKGDLESTLEKVEIGDMTSTTVKHYRKSHDLTPEPEPKKETVSKVPVITDQKSLDEAFGGCPPWIDPKKEKMANEGMENMGILSDKKGKERLHIFESKKDMEEFIKKRVAPNLTTPNCSICQWKEREKYHSTHVCGGQGMRKLTSVYGNKICKRLFEPADTTAGPDKEEKICVDCKEPFTGHFCFRCSI